MWPNHTKQQFEALVRAYSADLYRFAYWLARDRSVAEDLVQECYMRAWKHFDQLREEQAAKSWLFTILRNEHARLHAKPRAEHGAASLDEAEELADRAFSLPARIDLNTALHQLPDSHREPLLLQVLGGFSCAEIGTMLSLTETNVMARVSRARKVLRELIEPENFKRENTK